MSEGSSKQPTANLNKHTKNFLENNNSSSSGLPNRLHVVVSQRFLMQFSLIARSCDVMQCEISRKSHAKQPGARRGCIFEVDGWEKSVRHAFCLCIPNVSKGKLLCNGEISEERAYCSTNKLDMYIYISLKNWFHRKMPLTTNMTTV